MRYKPQHKEETRRRIVEAAAREFRTHGFEGAGIAKLMGALGLTHGGFYAHFADKEDLVAEAVISAFGQSLEAMLSALKAGGFAAMLDYYLSEGHRDNPALGCPLPTLAAEVARHSSPTRESFTARLSQVFDAVAEQMPGATPPRKREKTIFLFAAMAGAVSLARAVSDPAMSKAILADTRNNLLTFVGGAEG